MNSPALSPNATAILLLTAPLMVGRGKPLPAPLTPSEYKRLARHLREADLEPANLVSRDSEPVLQRCAGVVPEDRLRHLLARGLLLTQAVERWSSRAIWVVSRADPAYPRRIKSRLRDDAPPVLYGSGDINILNSGGLAVVGSRNIDHTLTAYAQHVGELAARSQRTLVSGGARGVDQAAMRGAWDAGGSVCGVLADGLEKSILNHEHREPLREGRLVLVSPYDPSSPFSVAHAMQRNRLIYAFADAGLVVNADLKKGGTWAGAVEQLDKLRLVPVFVRTSGDASPALEALRQKGALPWPDPQDGPAFERVLQERSVDERKPSEGGRASLPSSIEFSASAPDAPVAGSANGESGTTAKDAKPVVRAAASHAEVAGEGVSPGASASDMLFSAVRKALWTVLTRPLTAAEVAEELDVSQSQVHVWLRRLVDEGGVRKLSKPTRYVMVSQEPLFEDASPDSDN
jgi:DNA processing protein